MSSGVTAPLDREEWSALHFGRPEELLAPDQALIFWRKIPCMYWGSNRSRSARSSSLY
jgi:hypothetical protein